VTTPVACSHAVVLQLCEANLLPASNSHVTPDAMEIPGNDTLSESY